MRSASSCPYCGELIPWPEPPYIEVVTRTESFSERIHAIADATWHAQQLAVEIEIGRHLELHHPGWSMDELRQLVARDRYADALAPLG